MDTRAAHVLGRYILAAGLAVGALPTLLAWARPAPPGPRYQAAAPGSGNAFVLDTHTGQLWSKFVPGNQGNTNWGKDGSVEPAAK